MRLKPFNSDKELKKVDYANLEQYSLKNVLKQMAEIYTDK